MNAEKIKKGVKLLIEGIEDDPEREGLKKTPARIARMYEEIFCGIKDVPKKILTVLPAEKHDEIVLVKDIPFYSMCEHHLLPFLGACHIAYIPDKNITGISKLTRIVDSFSRRLQVQERLTTEIAECIMEALNPKGVMVIIEAEHLCLTMRGVRKPGSKVTTSAVRGIFRRNSSTRAEALALIGGK